MPTVKRHFQALDVKHTDRLHVVFAREPTGRERFRRLCGSVEALKPSADGMRWWSPPRVIWWPTAT